MSMSIIFHYDLGLVSFLVVVDYDNICTDVLGVYYFLGKFASSTFY